MNGFFTLAHLSDIHLAPARPYYGHLQAKRLLGMLNWHRTRRRQHLASTLAAIVTDALAQAPDHVAVTGDLVNVGLASEHAAAARWLAELGPAGSVTAVPGNHDIYVDMAHGDGIGRWQAFMAGDAETVGREPYPFVRRLGPIALVGLNSALPTPLFHAFGRLGASQLASLDGLLARLGEEGRVRIVLIHHPPLTGQAAPRAALQDAPELAAVLRRRGAEIVLHGHNHRASLAHVEGPAGPIPVVGVPSASLGIAHGRQMLARYNLYRFAPEPGAPIELVERGLAVPGGPVVELARRMLSRPELVRPPLG
ncbi:MAG: metallophosphoesterase [Hyphomicrobiaceae bacterium]